MPLSDEETWSLCRLGHQLYARERLEDARKIFEGIVAIDDANGYAWHLLGLIARRRDNWQRATECFQRRLRVDDDADSRVALAETLYEAGRTDDARDVLRPLRQQPDGASEAVRRGRVLLERWSGEA